MPDNPKRRKRFDSSKRPQNGVKKSKLSEGKARVEKADFSDDYQSDSGSERQNQERENMYSDSEDERLGGVGEEGVDLSELMDMDDTPVTEPDSNRPTADHRRMLSTLQKGLGLDQASQRAKAREEERSIMPARKENAFAVNAEGAAKVDLSELMAASTFSKETKKGLEKLDRSDRRLGAEESKYAKARSERAVAYEDTKAILSEWLPTVQSMRQADHVMFPLPEQVPKRERATTSGATTSFNPTTELEKTVFGLLDESGVTEARLQEAEDLATKKLSPEEMRARHQQIARLRSLYFYQEQKNKRQAKIKSKKYRKILKKAKQKNELTLAELKELDPEAYEEELEKMDKARALERVGIKHGHLGKWAKHALRSKDPHTMQAVRDHLDHGRRLRKKMATDRDGSDDDSDIDSDVSSIHSSDLDSEPEEFDDPDADVGEEGDIIDIHGNIVQPKKKRKTADEDDENAESGIFGMKFMQRATAKKQSDHDALMDEMDQEIEERRKKLKAQRRKAKDDFVEDGLKADSDSEGERGGASRPRKAIESDSEDEDDTSTNAAAADVTGRSGRRSVKSTPAQVTAAAMARQSFYHSDDDDGLDGNTMALDRPQGFSATLKGNITVQAKASKAKSSHQMDVEEDEEDIDSEGEDVGGSESEDGVHTFHPNSKDVKSALNGAAAKNTGAKKTKAQIKAEAAAKRADEIQLAKKKSGSSVDEDSVLVGSSISSKSKKSAKAPTSKGGDIDEDETVISFSIKSKASGNKAAVATTTAAANEDEDNPWMVVEEDDEGLVIPGTKAPGSKSGAASAAESTKKAKAKKAKKTSEDRVAVDLEKVQKKLADEEARRDGVVFNLSAAGATSKAQRELIERAFAADHVTEKEIASEKESMVEAANEVEEEYATLTLPGWGEWAGHGVRPSKRRKRILKEMEEKKAKRSEEIMAQRKDARLKHAIIGEDKNKHFTLYQAASVPVEFKDNAALYESSLRQPMGKEWNIRESHAKLVKPKVVVRSGYAIQPIQQKKEGIQRR